ncbi:MAG: hypothetical protein PHQ52_03335 [Candidatus Omnitrophica bacterium]|nr:hypothetical protein [Candidatus Omnitrophota bacterium]
MNQSKPKYRYEIDPYNNLIVESGKKTSAQYFRKVVNGKFRIGPKNQLEYIIRQPLDDKNFPRVIRLTGKWSLTEKHDLKLTISEDKKRSSATIILKGQIVETGKNSIGFSISQKEAANKERIYVLKIEGFWQVDNYNRINFNVKKEKGDVDNLVFSCGWEIDSNNSIVYTYNKADHFTGEKNTHMLEFKGLWKFTEKNRITYDISSKTGSEFAIRTAVVVMDKNSIKAELGIGLEKSKTYREITFFGKWQINKNIGLLFELEKQNNKQKNIKFGCEATLKNTSIDLNIKAYGTKKDLDIGLKLKRDIKCIDGQLFVELFKNKKESAVFLGVGGRF